MVFGFLLYEAVDITYNVIKLGYNSVTGVYNWYYQVEEKEKELKHLEALIEHKDTLKLIDTIISLNHRLETIEHKFGYKTHLDDHHLLKYKYEDNIEIKEID